VAYQARRILKLVAQTGPTVFKHASGKCQQRALLLRNESGQ